MLRRTRILCAGLIPILAWLMWFAPPDADAASLTGCKSQVVNKAMPWGMDYTYQYPGVRPTSVKIAQIRIVTTLTYAYCPNNNSPDKVMPLAYTYCHLHISKNSFFLFDGVKFNPFIADDYRELNEKTFKVPDGDGGEQVCVDVPVSEFKWFLTERSAGISVSAWLVFKTYPDQHIDFVWLDSTVRYFHPLEDVNVSDWY